MIRAWLIDALERLKHAVADDRTVRGFPVRIFGDSGPETDIVLEKLHGALGLIEAHGPRHHARLRRFAALIYIEPAAGRFLGAWIRARRMVMLDYTWLLRADTDAVQVASTIVHEVSHAWLESHGFEYRADRRARIEAVCFRAEAAFLRRVPGGAELADRHEKYAASTIEGGNEAWSDHAWRARQQRALDVVLRDLGLSESTIQTLRRWRGADSA